MSNLIKKIKIKKQDGTFTDYIPIGAEAKNIEMNNGNSVENEIDNIKDNILNIDGNISNVINEIEEIQSDIEDESSSRISKDMNLQNQIDQEKANRISTDANLQSQINAMTIPSGSSVISNEEITNARVAADFLGSTEYQTLGQSIRGQIGDLNNIINNFDLSIIEDRTSEAANIVKELYIEDLHNFSVYSLGIYKAYLSTSYNKYINIIRLWFGPTAGSKYANLYIGPRWDTQEAALAYFENNLNNRIVYFTCFDSYTDYQEIKGAILINADTQTIGTQKTYSLSNNIKDVTQLGYSPKIMASILTNKNAPNITVNHEITKALENSIGANNSYQCVDQFKENDFVKVYQNGMLVYPDEYTLYKQGKIVFNENVNYLPSNIYFEYDKYTKEYEDFENDLSENTNGFSLAKESGYTNEELYEFVSDPAGGNRNVLKCYCNEIKAGKVRVQWNHSISATEFTDSVKIYVPQELLNAFVSYSGKIDWFGFGGAWCPFGGTVGSTQNMYSGQGNGFDLYKEAGDSKVKYYIKNRFKAYSTETGKEIYTVQSSAISDFEVKGNEWITIKRELKVGNPGYCRMTVIDSAGTHVLKTGTNDVADIAYLGVADPENESVRYGDKIAQTIPYRKFETINLMKIYTSNEVVQHCINENGECALYFKDYTLSSKEVNTF